MDDDLGEEDSEVEGYSQGLDDVLESNVDDLNEEEVGADDDDQALYQTIQ